MLALQGVNIYVNKLRQDVSILGFIIISLGKLCHSFCSVSVFNCSVFFPFSFEKENKRDGTKFIHRQSTVWNAESSDTRDQSALWLVDSCKISQVSVVFAMFG